ncbi:transposase [Acetobacterium sp. MES1]
MKVFIGYTRYWPCLYACMLAKLVQIERFEDKAKIAKYAGLYWKRKQSGNFNRHH